MNPLSFERTNRDELKSLFSVKHSGDSNTTVNVKGNTPVEIEAEPIATFLLKSMNTCESNGLSVHNYADVLFNQPQLMFSGSALETIQLLRHNSHPQFLFRSAGGTYPDPNDNVHIYRLAVASIHKLIIESLEINIDESVMNLLAKQLKIEVTSDGQV